MLFLSLRNITVLSALAGTALAVVIDGKAYMDMLHVSGPGLRENGQKFIWNKEHERWYLNGPTKSEKYITLDKASIPSWCADDCSAITGCPVPEHKDHKTEQECTLFSFCKATDKLKKHDHRTEVGKKACKEAQPGCWVDKPCSQWVPEAAECMRDGSCTHVSCHPRCGKEVKCFRNRDAPCKLQGCCAEGVGDHCSACFKPWMSSKGTRHCVCGAPWVILQGYAPFKEGSCVWSLWSVDSNRVVKRQHVGWVLTKPGNPLVEFPVSKSRRRRLTARLAEHEDRAARRAVADAKLVPSDEAQCA